MTYVMGSEREQINFGRRLSYTPDGQRHAVDLTEPGNKIATFGYAACGTPVRIWPDTPFDPSGPNVHDTCRALAQP